MYKVQNTGRQAPEERVVRISSSGIMQAAALLPPQLGQALAALGSSRAETIREIRLRLGRAVTVTLPEGERFLCKSGGIGASRGDIIVTKELIAHVISRLFRDSLYSYRRELLEGYMTCEGGCRVGLCGRAVHAMGSDRADSITDISCINIRAAREVKGCADGLFRDYMSRFPAGLLIAGAPACGKTTLLRDLTRQTGSLYTTALIDERNEIAGSSGGVPSCDVGAFTDVLTSYSRYDGIMTAVRVMSPRVLVCDEIGSAEDLRALSYAVNSGVSVIASCHCGEPGELMKKPVIAELMRQGVFGSVAFVKDFQIKRTEGADKFLCLPSSAVS
ncbi:MAG: stage III sporulation protein AA [Ruminococcus sp.]|nr:stage III sporulation protein AA [Ruminococcus sp.]